MRRWVWRVVVCLALGVLTTVAVAWGISMSAQLRFGPFATRPPDGAQFRSPEQQYWHGQLQEWTGYSSLGLHPYRAMTHPAYYFERRIDVAPRWTAGWRDNLPTITHFIHVNRAGWPFKCLRGSAVTADYPDEPYSATRVREGLRVPNWTKRSANPHHSLILLPTSALCPAMLIDALFYAALWLAAITVVPTTRRLRRRQRGLCPACGYDLHGLSAARCPECGGATIPSSSCTTPPSQPA